MNEELKPIPFSTEHEGIDYPRVAKMLVMEEASALHLQIEELYVVWFAYILGGWKALVSTSRADGRYYEVTHNQKKSETYVDTYVKTNNSVYYSA